VGLELYNLRKDPGETQDVAAREPEVLSRMLLLAEEARLDLGDARTRRVGSGVREPGRVP
jgi:arylsulfatase